jgi:hypothetical protein
VIVSAADAMPADKYGFAPTDGEFKGVRTFGKMDRGRDTAYAVPPARTRTGAR